MYDSPIFGKKRGGGSFITYITFEKYFIQKIPSFILVIIKPWLLFDLLVSHFALSLNLCSLNFFSFITEVRHLLGLTLSLHTIVFALLHLINFTLK